MVDVEEYAERLADIGAGPWTERAVISRGYLQPQTNLDSLAFREDEIDLDGLREVLQERDLAREDDIERTLRWHGQGHDITSDREMVIRDSFDQALSYLHLVELAIESGYIDLESAREEVRREMLTLLWSRGARLYVVYYDSIGVEYLAQRVGIRGLRKVAAPEPDPEGSVRYASFLAQHADFTRDEHVEQWLGFMDEFVRYRTEQERFIQYLSEGRIDDSERMLDLLTGAYRFVRYLADGFAILLPSERPRYGLFYSYWLARFFGYRFGPNGYYFDALDWGAALSSSRSMLPADVRDEDGRAAEEELSAAIALIRETWNVTRELLARSAAPVPFVRDMADWASQALRG